MLKDFLEARRERIQKLIEKGFEVKISYPPVLRDQYVCITIKRQKPLFCRCGTYFIEQNNDLNFTATIEAAEKFGSNEAIDNYYKSIVENFAESLKIKA